MGPNEIILAVENISAGYEKLQILHNVSLKISKGEILALIGRNGAGKSTLFNVIVGINRKWSGNIYFNNQNITEKPTSYIYKAGISLMPQGGRIFPQLSIYENLIFNTESRIITKKNIGIYVENFLFEKAPKMFELFISRMMSNLEKKAGILSGGERQVLSIIRTLINENKILLFDEPTGGLSHSLIIELKDLIYQKAQNGCGIIFIEQKVKWTLETCDRICILQRGNIVYDGYPNVFHNDDDLLSKYLGMGNSI